MKAPTVYDPFLKIEVDRTKERIKADADIDVFHIIEKRWIRYGHVNNPAGFPLDRVKPIQNPMWEKARIVRRSDGEVLAEMNTIDLQTSRMPTKEEIRQKYEEVKATQK